MISKWIPDSEEQKRYISAMTEDLASLRAEAGASQENVCSMIGISRQTLSMIESRKKTMSWSVYLLLVFFFDSNLSTRESFRRSQAYPVELLNQINARENSQTILPGLGAGDLNEILEALDDQAIHTLKTMLLVEYARCKKIPGDAVVKAFEGIDLKNAARDAAAEEALRKIRKRRP